MSIQRVLVYGATGDQARPTALRLLLAGFEVRALSRHPDKAKTLQDAGAEVFKGDMDDPDSLMRASEGMDGVFLLIPAFGGEPGSHERYAKNAIGAAKAAGVRLVTWNTSRLLPDENSDAAKQDPMMDVLGYLRDSDVPFVMLQPNVYMENLLAPWTAPRVAKENVLQYPHPSAFATQWTASQDIGGATVEAFRRVEEVAGSSHPILSTQPLSGDAMAEAFSKGLDRDIRYEPLEPDTFGEILGDIVGKEAGRMMAGRYQMIFDNPDAFSTNIDMAPVLDKLPFAPTPLEDWVRQNREVFSEPAE